MSVISNNQLAGAAGQGGSTAYEIQRSLRFNSGDSSRLTRTLSANVTTFTMSFWFKYVDSTRNDIYVTNSSYGHFFYQHTDGSFRLNNNTANLFISNGVYRDPSAWYHIVVTNDGSNFKLYVNGVLDKNQSTGTYLNSGNFYIGNDGSSTYANCYLADVHFIDGQALAPTDFGEFDDNNVWQPKEFTGTHGTNGFHLDFSDNSSAAALGTDSSGNSNTWTVNNLIATAVNYTSISTLAALSGSSLDSSYNDVSKVFDGSGTGVRTITEGSNQGEKLSITFSPAITLNNETVSIDTSSTYQGMFVTVDGSDGSRVSGSDSNTSTLTTGSLSGSLSKITVDNGTDTSGRPASILRIRIGGTVVQDLAASNIDSLIDTPTNYTAGSGNNGGNYATLNPLNKHNSNNILSNGNLEFTTSGSDGCLQESTIGMSSGKFYFEVVYSAGGTGQLAGIRKSGERNYNDSYIYVGTGNKYTNGGSGTGYGASLAHGDVIGTAFDADNGTLTFYKNGVSQGQAFSGISGTYSFFVGSFGVAPSGVVNFGQRPFAISSVPAGHLALCTTNLPDPAIADGSTVFDAKLYTGNASTQAVTGLNFQPDLVWLKRRDGAGNNNLQDVVRGASAFLQSDYNGAESTSGSRLASFDTNGFTLTSDNGGNASGGSYVAWTWDAGTSTVTNNTDGSITPTGLRANPSAGFSIVTYNGTGSNATFGHGLNTAPELVIVKSRSDAQNWAVQHSALGPTYYGYLQSTNAFSTTSGGPFWNNTAPTSSVVNVGTDNDTNASGKTYVAYCFAPVAGYSAFGSYTGNGLTDGPFVYTGFRPRFVLLKRSDTTGNWFIFDTARGAGNTLWADLSDSEDSSYSITITSSGFEVNGTAAGMNASGGTYIYAAFAEHPFKTARAR